MERHQNIQRSTWSTKLLLTVTQADHDFTGEKDSRRPRRPPGRTNQREEATMEIVVTKQNSDTKTVLKPIQSRGSIRSWPRKKWRSQIREKYCNIFRCTELPNALLLLLGCFVFKC